LSNFKLREYGILADAWAFSPEKNRASEADKRKRKAQDKLKKATQKPQADNSEALAWN
jgi:hypothetical protein